MAKQLHSGTLYIDLDNTVWDEVHSPVGAVVEMSIPVEYVELCFYRSAADGDKYLSTVLIDPRTGRTVRSWDYSQPETVERDREALSVYGGK